MIDSKIDRKLVLHAIKVLQELQEKHEECSRKKPLMKDDEEVFLQVTLKKVPKMKSIKMIKVRLPHTLMQDTTDVCFIAGDLDKRNHKAEIEPDILHYKELLNKHGVSQISEIMTLRQLRTEYKPYEAKQKLLAAYDVFLADSRIIECLPRVLGKHFFKKRKFPIRIDMKTTNLKNQIENALSTKVIYVTGHGNSCISEVAYLHMKNKKIADNVMSIVDTLSKELPGSLDNVMGFYLKTAKSKSIPIYLSYGSPNDVYLPDLKEEEDFKIDDLSTIPNAKVKVFSTGRVETVKNSILTNPNGESEDSESVSDSKEITETKMSEVASKHLSVQSDSSCDLTETTKVEGKHASKLKKKFVAVKEESACVKEDVSVKPDKRKKSSIMMNRTQNVIICKTETKNTEKDSDEEESKKDIKDEVSEKANKRKKTKKIVNSFQKEIITKTEAKGVNDDSDVEKSKETSQETSGKTNSELKAKRKRARKSEFEFCFPEVCVEQDSFPSPVQIKKKVKLDESNNERPFVKNQKLKSKKKKENHLRAK